MEYEVSTHDSIQGRESTEWSNFWYDQADTKSEHRILLIGDSTVRMIRSKFAVMKQCPVDMLGTSSGLHDILFVEQVRAFFSTKSYEWDTIFVQIGHHSRINDLGMEYLKEDYDLFEKEYCSFIKFLFQFSKNVVLVGAFYSVVPNISIQRIESPILKKLFMKWLRISGYVEIYDETINHIKESKNARIKNVGELLNIPYIDIASYMEELRTKRNKNYLHVDHIHYEKKALPEIVKKYMEYIPW